MTFHNDAIFWVEVHKIKPNPFQPRREFDEGKLQDLADSIRQYGVLQPLVVTRKEIFRDDGGMVVEYELIAGERRLRAARLAGVGQVPVVIRSDDEDESVKLELAIIENLQREDLNPIDRARAFKRLVEDFGYKHTEVARKIGRSREYVSNSVRLLQLPEDMLAGIIGGHITEGHSRPLLMLTDRPEEQKVLFEEIQLKKLTVREAEDISRRIAKDRVRKNDYAFNPELVRLEEEMSEALGTRVQISPKEIGGRIMIEFSSDEDLLSLIAFLKSERPVRQDAEESAPVFEEEAELVAPEEKEIRRDEDDDLYAITNFSI